MGLGLVTGTEGAGADSNGAGRARDDAGRMKCFARDWA